MLQSEEEDSLRYDAIIREVQTYQGKVILRSKIRAAQIHVGDTIHIYNNNGDFIAPISKIDRKGRSVELATNEEYVGIIVETSSENLAFVKSYHAIVTDIELQGFIKVVEA